MYATGSYVIGEKFDVTVFDVPVFDVNSPTPILEVILLQRKNSMKGNSKTYENYITCSKETIGTCFNF